MILGKYLLTDLVLYLKFSKHVITGGDDPYEGHTAPMIDIVTYRFEPLNLKDQVNPEK